MCLEITRIKKFQSSLRNLSQGIALGHDKFPAEIPPPKSVFTAKFWSKVRYSYAWSRIVSGKLWKLEGVDDECRHTGEQVSNRFSLRGKLESLVNCWSGSWADEGAFVVESSIESKVETGQNRDRKEKKGERNSKRLLDESGCGWIEGSISLDEIDLGDESDNSARWL